MKDVFRFSPRRVSYSAFSLIEVVIALAVVATSLVVIVGLAGVFLQTTTKVIDQGESLSVTNALSAYLQSQGTSTQPAFDAVYSAARAGTLSPIYAYSTIDSATGAGQTSSTAPSNGVKEMKVVSGTYSGLSTEAAYRDGRLFYIYITLSPNVPFHVGIGRTLTQPLASNLPASIYPISATDSSFYADAMLALSVRIYVVSVPNPTTDSPTTLEKNGNYPKLVYDTAISR